MQCQYILDTAGPLGWSQEEKSLGGSSHPPYSLGQSFNLLIWKYSLWHVPIFQIYTTYDAKSCCTYMLENVAVSKYFLLQRIKAPAGRMEVSPGWKEVILARERRQSASIDG